MRLAGLASLVAFAAFALAASGQPLDERRVAWGGLVRGPLSPADARALEGELIAAIGDDERILLVDAAGHPLGRVARQKEIARVERLLREGIDQVLRGKHDAGRARIDQAVALFERSLGAHENHAVLHDALLAQAESLFERGQKESAKTTLVRLHALSPDLVPTEPPGLVSLWREARVTKAKPGRLEVAVSSSDPAEIRLDGKPLGPAPVTVPKLSPGLHLLAVEWHDATVSQAIQIAPGRPMRVTLSRPELGEKARAELVDAASARSGPATVTSAIPRLATMSSADEVVVAVARPDGVVVLSRHGSDGLLRRAVGATAPTSFGSAASRTVARRLSAAVLLDRPLGGFRLDGAGAETAWPAAASEAYGGPPPLPAPTLEDRADAVRGGGRFGGPGSIAAEAPEPAIYERPWFWVLVGVAAAGLAVGAVVVLQPEPTTTVIDVVFPSRSP